jgi:hypothetical protein
MDAPRAHHLRRDGLVVPADFVLVVAAMIFGIALPALATHAGRTGVELRGADVVRDGPFAMGCVVP